MIRLLLCGIRVLYMCRWLKLFLCYDGLLFLVSVLRFIVGEVMLL